MQHESKLHKETIPDLSNRIQGLPYRVKAMPNSTKRKNSKFTLPWWCRILAWILCIFIVIACGVIVLSYAIEFGDSKTQKWLISLVISFAASIFFSQPLTVSKTLLMYSILYTEKVNNKFADFAYGNIHCLSLQTRHCR